MNIISSSLIKRCAQWVAGERHLPFLRTVGAVAVTRLSGGLLLFLSQMLLAAWMGTEAFGIYSYSWAWVAVLATFAGAGFGATSVRFLATYRAQHEEDRVRGLLRFGRALTLAASLLVTLCGLVGTMLMDPDSPYLEALRLSFLAIPGLAWLWLESAYARGFDWMTLSTLAEQIGRPVMLILLGWLLFTYGIRAEASAYVIAGVLAYAIAMLGQHLALSARLRRRVGDGPAKRDTRTWVGVSAGMLLLNGVQMMRLNTDLLLVGWLLSPRDVGIYTAAVRTATLVSFVMTVASVVAQPRLAEMYAQNRHAELQNFITAATRSVFLASLAIGAALAVSGAWVLGLFGAEFIIAYPAMMILVAAHVLVAGSGPLTSLLTMTGHQESAALTFAGLFVSGVLLNVMLIPPFGILGAAIATGSNLLLAQCLLLAIVKRRLGLSFTIFLNRSSAQR